MAPRYASFEVEQMKQLALVARLPTHHGKPPPPNHFADGITIRRKSRGFCQQHRSFSTDLGASDNVRCASIASKITDTVGHLNLNL
jgi:hypothetical protein